MKYSVITVFFRIFLFTHIFPTLIISNADEDINENVAYMEQLERLDSAIESLPSKCKEVFTLVYLKQQRYEDVAMQLNVSYHTVKAHMTTAFKHIRKNLLLLFFFFRSVK